MNLNGKEIKDKNVKTLQDLMILYDFNINNIAVLVNGQIVKKEQWGNYTLSKDDNIEIVGFVGGG